MLTKKELKRLKKVRSFMDKLNMDYVTGNCWGIYEAIRSFSENPRLFQNLSVRIRKTQKGFTVYFKYDYIDAWNFCNNKYGLVQKYHCRNEK